MTIQQKISTVVVALILLYGAGLYAVLEFQMMPAFRSLETDAIGTDFTRARNALYRDIRRVAITTGDWAPWDDTYRFVRGENDGYIDANLDLDTFEVLDLDIALFMDSLNTIRWGYLSGHITAKEDVLRELELSDGNIERLLRHDSAKSAANGVVETNRGLLIVSSRPIVTNDYSGPIAGTVLFGYFLGEERLAEMRSRTEVKLDLLPTSNPDGSFTDLAKVIVGSPSGRFSDANKDLRFEYSILKDIGGNPLSIIRVSMPREIESLGQGAVGTVLSSLFLVLVLVAATTWLSLQLTVVRPLARLGDHMSRIRKTGDLTERIGSTGKDEAGRLASTFDELVDELQMARHDLLSQSFKAGMAETAAEVLHNIRNALTPLVNRITSASRSLENSGDPHLERAMNELLQTDVEPVRRQKLQEYVTLGLADLEETRGLILADLRVAASQGNQIESILADQEHIAHAEPVIEAVELHNVVIEASGVVPCQGADALIVVDDNLRNIKVRAHRVGLLQILSNILLNAYESIQLKDNPGGRIIISATSAPDQSDLVRLSVTDNGIGIPNDLMQRIFERGFTIKTHGRGGLGLHWCANAIAGMGGRISANSDGPGLGALFELDIPMTSQSGGVL